MRTKVIGREDSSGEIYQLRMDHSSESLDLSDSDDEANRVSFRALWSLSTSN